MPTKRFHRHLPSNGYALYWILLIYLVLGFFYPIIGLLALICMIAPVAFAVKTRKMVVWKRLSSWQFL